MIRNSAKVRDIAKSHQLNSEAFDRWIRQPEFQFKSRMTGLSVDDGVDTNDIVLQFHQYLAQEKVLFGQEQERLASERATEEQAVLTKQSAMEAMFITSGFNFEGYSITKYSSYISGDAAVSMDRPTQGWFISGVNKNVGADLLTGLSDIRQKALTELKSGIRPRMRCCDRSGLRLPYIGPRDGIQRGGGTLYLPFLFAVTANGNAVVTEKN